MNATQAPDPHAVDAEVDRHYGTADVLARIYAALSGTGHDLDALTRADLTPFDEFHGGGIASTRELARFAALEAGMEVVDIGCGIGGPARTLAAEFGCRVTGVDLTREFVRAAIALTGKVGMTSSCRFVHGSATALPLPNDAFDAAWSQNMMMNVADKAALFGEVHRVLRPGGTFAFEAVLAGDGGPVLLPSFWASRPELSFLVTREELTARLQAAGLELVALHDTTDAVIETARKRRAALAAPDPAQLTVAVIVPDDVEAKMENALRNNEEGRTRTVKGVCRKPA